MREWVKALLNVSEVKCILSSFQTVFILIYSLVYVFTVWANAGSKWNERIFHSVTLASYVVGAEAVHISVHGLLSGSICSAVIFTLEPGVCICLLFWSFCVLPLATLCTIREETAKIMQGKKISPRLKPYGGWRYDYRTQYAYFYISTWNHSRIRLTS